MSEQTNTKDTGRQEQTGREELIKIDRMYESLRYNDYAMENGLGEIVDNAVEAGASQIAITITQEAHREPGQRKDRSRIAEIAVSDNGVGMDYGLLQKCLVLGESVRLLKHGRMGIGRFGVGLTLGGISLAKRIEVYSRAKADEPFFYTYIDLREIQKGLMKHIPSPVDKQPDTAYLAPIGNSSGTVVVLKDCDRVSANTGGKAEDSGEIIKRLSGYLGRTYRKFIAGGINITLDGKKVYLHDPLYLMGPTAFDVEEKGKTDPKATPWGELHQIPLEIPGSGGKTAPVTIRMSLLPKEWRQRQGAGGSPEAKKRKIDQNEGISILRADREVLYGHVPYLTGKKGEAASQDIDRWWGCEISFPPELDSYFQVKYIKRGAEPVQSLRDQIRGIIGPAVGSIRLKIQEEWSHNEFEESQRAGHFHKAEDTMANLVNVMPVNKMGMGMNEEEVEKKLDELMEELMEPAESEEARKQKKREIRQKPYSIQTVRHGMTTLFAVEHLMGGNMVVKVNVNHPFYTQILLPLCIPTPSDGAEDARHKRKLTDGIMLLLLSFAKAEATFDNDATYDNNGMLFELLRSQWGAMLAAALNSYKDE